MTKTNKKIITFLMFIPFLFFILMFYDVTTVYALSYDNQNVGIIENLHEINDINDDINSKIANGNINLDKKMHKSFLILPKQSVNTHAEIVKNIIENTQEIDKKYGLIINNKVCYISNNKTEIINKINKIKKDYLEKNKLNNCYNEEYEIKYNYYLTNINYTDDDIALALNFTSSKYIYKEKIIKTKYNIKKIKDYTRVGNDENVIQKGKFGRTKLTYKITYTNGILINKEMIKSTTIKKPITEIISVPYKKAQDNEVLLKNVTENQRLFIQEILPEAIILYKEKNILPSLTLAQAILESAWGTSSIGNNIYGIKAYSDWEGEKSYVWTSEQNKDGSYEKIKCWFKNYDSFSDSVKDYGMLLSNSRYDAVRNAKNYRDAVAAVRMAGYATSLDYVDNVINLIETHHLYMWDKIKKPVSIKESKLQQKWNEELQKIKEKNKEQLKKSKQPTSQKTSKTLKRHAKK